VRLAFYNRALSIKINKRIKDKLSYYIILLVINLYFLIILNFFIEVKALNKDLDIVKRKAYYYSTLGARVIYKLQIYKEDLFYNNKAYTITLVYNLITNILKLYIIYLTCNGEINIVVKGLEFKESHVLKILS
jgi:hypothetical protein